MFNQFLDMVSLEDGKGAAAKDVMQKKGLPTDRLMVLGPVAQQ